MRARARPGGFTYLGLIILVAVIGMVGAAALKVGSLLQRAAAEEELLSIGAAFSDALRSYAAATPPGRPQQPPTLQELLRDPRFPTTRRHLRKIFVDPMTGKAEWGVMYLGDKVGVLGVYSLSDAKPLKVGNFDPRFLNMENKQHYSDWKFTLSSLTLTGGVQQPMTPGAPAVPGAPAAQPSLFGAPPPPSPPTSPSSEPAAPAEAAPPEPEKPMEPKSDAELAADEKAEAEEKAEQDKKEKEEKEKEGEKEKDKEKGKEKDKEKDKERPA